MSKLLKKSATAEVEEMTPNESRPASVTFNITFADDNRKVTPADLERAAEAAASALRTSLESRTPKYRIASIGVAYDYVYVMARKAFSG